MSTTKGEGYPEMFAGLNQDRSARSTGVIRLGELHKFCSRHKLLVRDRKPKRVLVSVCHRVIESAVCYRRRFKYYSHIPKKAQVEYHPRRVEIGDTFRFKRFWFKSYKRVSSLAAIVTIITTYMSLCCFALYVRFKSLEPCSGTEKDLRRDLYSKKKASKKAIKYDLHPTHHAIVIPRVTKQKQLRMIYDELPDFTILDPKGGLDIPLKDRFLLWALGANTNKKLVEKIVALFESLSFLLVNMYQASSRRHQVCILLMWVQNRFVRDKSVLLNMTDIVCWFSGYKPDEIIEAMMSVKKVCSGEIDLASFFRDKPADEPFELDPKAGPEGDNGTPTVHAFVQSETITRFKTTLQMFVDAGLCNIFGYEFDFSKGQKTLDWFNTSIHKIELVEYVSSTIMYFVSRGYAAYDKGSIKHLFFSDEWICFDLEFTDLQCEMDKIFSGFHVGSTPCLSSLRARILRLIAIVRKQIPTAPFLHRKALTDRLVKLNGMQKDLLAFDRKSGMRKAPVAILAWGNSGVCKSWVSITLMYSILKHLGLPCDEYFVRTPNLADQFDSNLDADTVGIILDDVANEKMEMLQSSPVEPLLRLINNVVAMANKASLEEKGSVFLEPQVVLATSNMKDMNAHQFSIERLSILRRLDCFIHVKMAAQYMSSGKSDMSKWPEANRLSGQPPLTFTVERVSAQPVSDNTTTGPVVPQINATYTHVAQVPVFNVVKWFDPVAEKEISLNDIDFVTLERFCCHQAELKLRDQESFIRTVKRTANPLKCIHNNTFPYCELCESKILIALKAIRRWKYIVKNRYSFAFTWRHGVDTKNTHKNTPRPRINRKLEKVELRKSMVALFKRPYLAWKLDKPCYQVVFMDGKYQFRSRDMRREKAARHQEVLDEKAKLALTPSSAQMVPPLLVPGTFPELDPEWLVLPSEPLLIDDRDQIPLDIFTGGLQLLRLGRFFSSDDSDYEEIDVGSMADDFESDHTSDSDSSDSEDSDDDTDSITSYDREHAAAFDELHTIDTRDIRDMLLPRGDVEGVEETKESRSDLDQKRCEKLWIDMCNWWNHLGSVSFITQVDIGLLDLGFQARTKLHYRNVMKYAPVDISEVPPQVPPMSDDSFLFRSPPKYQITDITNLYICFRQRVLDSQKKFVDINSDLDSNEEVDVEEISKLKRVSCFLSIGSCKIAKIPYRFGDWVLKKTGDENSAIAFSLSGCIVSCLATFAFILSSPVGLMLSIVGTVFGGAFWCCFSIAMYVGIAQKRLIAWCNTALNTCQTLARVSRYTLKHKHAVIFGSLALLAVGAAYYKHTRKKKEPELEPSSSVVVTPIPRVNERTNNYWVANRVSIEESCGVSGYQNTPDELLNAVATQLVRIRIYPPEVRNMSETGGKWPQTCCGITTAGGLLILPRHIAFGKENRLISVMRSGPGQVRNNANWIIAEGSMYAIEGTDLIFMHTVHLGAAKDLRMYLPTKLSKDTMRVKWLLKESSTSGPFPIVRGNAEAVYNATTPVAGVDPYEGYNMKLYDECGASLVSKTGWCMSVFVTQTNPSCIHSVYLAGKDHAHRSAPILRSYVDAARDHFAGAGMIMLPSSGTFTPGKGGIKDSAGKRSPISHLDKCEEVNMSFDWLGSSTDIGDFRRMNGRVRTTPFAPHLRDVMGVEHTWASPKNLGGWQPWYTNLTNMGAKLEPFEANVFEIAKKDLRESLLGKCAAWRGFSGETFEDVVHPVDEEVALNGVPGVSGCDRVKLNTSAGYPMNCPKKKVIEIVDDPKYPDGRLEPNDDIKRHTAYILDCADKEVRSYVTFRASPKDEPTPPTKEKVRIFAGCPVAYLIAVRMYTCMLVKFMTDNHLLFNTVAGANAHDYDWTLAGMYLAEYSITNLIAGDYSDYDKKLLAMFMVAAVELTLDMLRLAGYTVEQLRIAKNLMLEACYAVYEWNGDFILVLGTNPSGQPLTVWLNNLANLLYQRYVFYTFYPPAKKFDDCVRILVMGDDNLMSVKDGYEKYNHTSIQEVLGAKGLAYTMADKSTISKPYIPIEEVTLLKRRFVWSPEFETYMCPIEEKSIYRCLYSHMLENGDHSETVRDHCMHMCDTAMAEWFYFGRDVYDDRFSKVCTLLDRVGMSEHKVRLLSYDQQVLGFKSRVLKSRCLFGKEVSFSWLADYSEPQEVQGVEYLPSGGFAGYDLKPEYGFREVFVGRKHETHAECWNVIGSRRSLVIVDCYITSDIYAVPALFEPRCWIETFDIVHLGIHHGDYFDDDDPRILYRRNGWVLLKQDDRLNDIYLRSLRDGVTTIDGVVAPVRLS